MLLAHFRIGNTKSNTFLHFFIIINLYHAQPTTNMYNSSAFFVHKPFSFIQIAFCYFGMNYTGYQTRKWFVKIEHPLKAFTFLVPQKKKKKERNEKKLKQIIIQYFVWLKLRKFMATKLTLHSSSKCCKVILCNVEITERGKKNLMLCLTVENQKCQKLKRMLTYALNVCN